MKLSFRYFALVVMGALISGCAEEVEDLQPAANGNVTMKTTVSLDERASTRALTEAGVKTFTAGDQIAVVYEQASGTAKALSVALTDDDITNSGKDAAFTVTLSSPKANGKVRYIYPASMVADDVSTTAPGNDATIKWSNLNTQDGLLSSLESKLDLATFDGEMTAQGNLPKTATLANQLTICKFTLKDFAGTSTLDALTSATITDGTYTYTITPASPATVLTWPIYVAMKSVTDDKTITVTATTNATIVDGATLSYKKQVTGNALAAGNIYPVNVKMNRLVNMTGATNNVYALHGDILTGTLNPYYVEIPDGATVTLRDVSIISSLNGVYCDANATIILEGSNVITSSRKAGILGWYKYDSTNPGPVPTLEIKGSGSLTVSGGTDGGAGIGSCEFFNPCGNILISGGIIIATGGTGSAGIGSGMNSNYRDDCYCGNITITGGNVTAIAGGGGNSNYNISAGIGCGYRNSCGAITISGGTVHAKTTFNDVGAIGKNEFTGSTCPSVTITNDISSVAMTNTFNRTIYNLSYHINATTIQIGGVSVITSTVLDGTQTFGSVKATFDSSTNTLTATPNS